MSDAPLPQDNKITGRAFRPSDVFEIIVRTIGLIIALYGFYSLAEIVAAWQFAYSTPGFASPPVYTQSGYTLHGFFNLFFGLLLVFGGKWIARLAYGRSD